MFAQHGFLDLVFSAASTRRPSTSLSRALRVTLFGMLVSISVAAAHAAPPVSLELVVEDGAALTTAHQWLPMLQDSGASVRIRGARPGDRIEVKTLGSATAPSYHVTGVLTRRNTLQLPGGDIAYGDKAALERWLEKLRSGGADALSARTVAFGLTEQHFTELYQQLAVVVAQETRGQTTSAVLDQLRERLPISVSVAPAAQRPLATAPPVPDELQGVSSGTALAAILRPLGLAFAPRRTASGEILLRIDRAEQLPEFWPVGWPLKSGQRVQSVMPKALQFLTVEIEDVTLEEALAMLSQRLEAPFLMDHNGMAKHGIDPSTLGVELPSARTFYMKVVDRLLFQCGLKKEVRVDEAGKGFLWIEPIKK